MHSLMLLRLFCFWWFSSIKTTLNGCFQLTLSDNPLCYVCATWIWDGGKQWIMRTCALRYSSAEKIVHLYFRLLTNVENKNNPEVEKNNNKKKSSRPFETSLKETSVDFPNNASLWRGGKSTFSPCWWKNRHPNETAHAQTTLTFIKEILTLNDK